MESGGVIVSGILALIGLVGMVLGCRHIWKITAPQTNVIVISSEESQDPLPVRRVMPGIIFTIMGVAMLIISIARI